MEVAEQLCVVPGPAGLSPLLLCERRDLFAASCIPTVKPVPGTG